MQIYFINAEYCLIWQHCLVIVQQKSISYVTVLCNLCTVLQNIFKILVMLSFILRLKYLTCEATGWHV